MMRGTGAASAVVLLIASALHVASAMNLTGYPADYVFIDCGSLEEPGRDEGSFSTNITTVAAGSVEYTISEPWMEGAVRLPNLTPEEATFRAFPSGKGCYNIAVPATTYSVRLGFAYYGYDGLSGGAPNFTVSVQGEVVDQVALDDWENTEKFDKVSTAPWGGAVGSAHYTEYVTATDGTPLEICLESVNERSPLVNTIELVPTEVPEMNRFLPEMKWKLSLKKRFNMAGPTVGPAVEEDPLLRKWVDPTDSAQIYFLFPLINLVKPEYSNISIAAADNATSDGVDGNATGGGVARVELQRGMPPFPSAVFETALQGGKLNESDPRNPQFLGVRFNYFPFNSFNQLLIRLLFAEINGNVTSPGHRTFNVSFAAKVARDKYLWEGQWHEFEEADGFDVFDRAGGADIGVLAPFIGCYPEPMEYRRNVSLFLFLSSLESELPPILNAVELYEVIAPLPNSCPTLMMQPGWNMTTSYPPIEEEEAPSQGGMSPGVIVGIVIGCVLGGTLLIAAIVFLVKMRAHHKATSFQRFQQSEGLVSEGA